LSFLSPSHDLELTAQAANGNRRIVAIANKPVAKARTLKRLDSASIT